MKSFFFRQKYRLDLGQQFLSIINLVLLLVAVSDKIKPYTSLGITAVIALAVPGALFLIWLSGYFLDRGVRYSQNYNTVAAARNPQWLWQEKILNRIDKKLTKILGDKRGRI